jgi:hypothetical protein
VNSPKFCPSPDIRRYTSASIGITNGSGTQPVVSLDGVSAVTDGLVLDNTAHGSIISLQLRFQPESRLDPWLCKARARCTNFIAEDSVGGGRPLATASLRQVRLNAAVTVACATGVGVFTAREVAIYADRGRVRAWR